MTHSGMNTSLRPKVQREKNNEQWAVNRRNGRITPGLLVKHKWFHALGLRSIKRTNLEERQGSVVDALNLTYLWAIHMEMITRQLSIHIDLRAPSHVW